MLTLKARRITKRKKVLQKEKNDAYIAAFGSKPKNSLTGKIHNYLTWIKRRLCSLPTNSFLHKTCMKLKRNETLENFYLKSFLGFLGGYFLTYIIFMFFIFTLNFKLYTATAICASFGTVLTLGLAFSQKVR